MSLVHEQHHAAFFQQRWMGYKFYQRNCTTMNQVLIKERCYSVTIAIINFVWLKFDRVFHKDSANAKFDDFKEGLVATFFRNILTCKNACISYGSTGGLNSLSVIWHWKSIHLVAYR